MSAIPRVLHLNAYFTGRQARLYREMYMHLALRHDIPQDVFVPVRSAASASSQPPGTDLVRIHITEILRPWHRVFFGGKVRTIVRRVIATHDMARYGIVHAHTLFTDGAPAYELYRRFGIPFLTAVRNTDVNLFLRHLRHLRGRAYRILNAARSVVFLAPAYRDRVIAMLPPPWARAVAEKAVVIPNGIDEFWHQHGPPNGATAHRGNSKVLYVGEFSRNKNLRRLIEACDFARQVRPEITLRLVGNYGDDVREINRMARKRDYVTVVDRLKEKEQLLAEYRSAGVFAMPSTTETFGLVYAESLSQGTPVICSSGQGFDGWFTPGVCGRAVNSRDTRVIARALLEVPSEADQVRCREAAATFRWPVIADQYAAVYRTLMTPGR